MPVGEKLVKLLPPTFGTKRCTFSSNGIPVTFISTQGRSDQLE